MSNTIAITLTLFCILIIIVLGFQFNKVNSVMEGTLEELRKVTVITSYLELLSTLEDEHSKNILTSSVINAMTNPNQQSIFNFGNIENQNNINKIQGDTRVN